MADDPKIVRVVVRDGPAVLKSVQRGPVGPEGTIGFVGAYSGATAYSTNDVVRDQGSSWIALQGTTGNAPPTLPKTKLTNGAKPFSWPNGLAKNSTG